MSFTPVFLTALTIGLLTGVVPPETQDIRQARVFEIAQSRTGELRGRLGDSRFLELERAEASNLTGDTEGVRYYLAVACVRGPWSGGADRPSGIWWIANVQNGLLTISSHRLSRRHDENIVPVIVATNAPVDRLIYECASAE